MTGGNAADFGVANSTCTTVVPSATCTFDVTFTPSATGARSTTVSIDSDDQDEDPFTFAVGGAGVALDLSNGVNTMDVVGGYLVLTREDGTTVSTPIASLGGTLELNGTAADETVEISEALATSGLTITINLGDGFDTVKLQNGNGDAVNHTFDNANDGKIVIVDGVATTTMLYTGADPIIDNFDVANRVFTFSAVTETITLTADGDGASDNNISFIDSEAAEEVSFVNPTGSLTINAGGGNSTLVLGLLDTSSGVLPPVAVTVNGGTGQDTFEVTPGSGYTSLALSGGVPAVCPGDVP